MADAVPDQHDELSHILGAHVIYQAATSHWTHSEQIRWTLLYNYLMASTILLLAWSTLFGSLHSEVHAHGALLLTAISAAGAFISAVWVLLGIRASGFVAEYHGLGLRLEAHVLQLDGAGLAGPFSAAERYRVEVGRLKWWRPRRVARLARSGIVVSLVPGIFLVLYGYLVAVSIGWV
jgi:hypothetical protein